LSEFLVLMDTLYCLALWFRITLLF